MGAAESLEDGLNGIAPGTGPSGNNTNVPLSWRPVYVRARTVLSNTIKKTPFSWPWGGKVPATVSAFDQLVGTAEQVAWRFVDAYGNVWDQKALNLVLLQWLLDGAPTPLSLTKIAAYRKAADTLNPWPQGFAGIFAGEETRVYPPFPPAEKS